MLVDTFFFTTGGEIKSKNGLTHFFFSPHRLFFSPATFFLGGKGHLCRGRLLPLSKTWSHFFFHHGVMIILLFSLPLSLYFSLSLYLSLWSSSRGTWNPEKEICFWTFLHTLRQAVWVALSLRPAAWVDLLRGGLRPHRTPPAKVRCPRCIEAQRFSFFTRSVKQCGLIYWGEGCAPPEPPR